MKKNKTTNTTTTTPMMMMISWIISMFLLVQGVSGFGGGFPHRRIVTPKLSSQRLMTFGRQEQRRRRSLCMHIGGHGHGHGDHHHHDHDHHHHDHNHKTDEKNLSGEGGGGGRRGGQQRKETSRVLLAALTVLVSVLARGLRRKFLTNTITTTAPLPPLLSGSSNAVTFVSAIATLTIFDGIRNEVTRMYNQIRKFRYGLTKHAPFDIGRLFRSDDAADRVTMLGVITNLFLSAGKLGVGVLCHSNVLVADAGHSLSDLFSDFVTLWAVQIGRLPPDEDHPYGHGKFEAIGSLFLAFTLLGTGFGVATMATRRLLEILALQGSARSNLSIPTLPALLMAGLSILSKEWLYRITRRVGERLNSPVVIANAWHHRSDAYSSILALVSIGIAMTVPTMLAIDSAAGLLVAGMISITGFEIMGEAVHQLTDSNNLELVDRVHHLISSSQETKEDVAAVRQVRVRQMGSSAIVDASISMANDLSSSATRAMEDRLRHLIIDEIPGVIDADVRLTGPRLCPLVRAAIIEEQTNNHDHASHHINNNNNNNNINLSRNNATTIGNQPTTALINGTTTPLNAMDESSSSSSSHHQQQQQELLPKRAADIEQEARHVLLTQSNNVVKSVESIIVHYLDPHIIAIDANIRLHNPNLTTVSEASYIALDLQRMLIQSSESIHLAKIFLDLNDVFPLTSSSSSSSSPPSSSPPSSSPSSGLSLAP